MKAHRLFMYDIYKAPYHRYVSVVLNRGFILQFGLWWSSDIDGRKAGLFDTCGIWLVCYLLVYIFERHFQTVSVILILSVRNSHALMYRQLESRRTTTAPF